MIINGKWMNEPEIIALISQLTADKKRLERQLEQSVKRGKWDTHDVVKVLFSGETLDGFCQCMACGDVFPLHYSEYNYCPNCGADMRGTEI